MRGPAFFRPAAAQNAFHRHVAFVAGVFVNRSVGAPHRDADRPRPREHRGIVHRVAIVDGIVVDEREALDDRQMIGRAATAVVAGFVDVPPEV